MSLRETIIVDPDDNNKKVNLTATDELPTHDAEAGSKLDALQAAVDALNGAVSTASNQDTQTTRLTEIRDYVDGVETHLASLLADIATYEGNRNADDDALRGLLGEVQASPTANTVLDRLRTVATTLSTISTNLTAYEGNRNTDQDLTNTRLGDITSPAAGSVNARLASAVTSLSSLVTNLATYETNRNADQDLLNTRVGDITTPATGTLLDRLLQLKTSIDSMVTNAATYEGNRNTDADALNARLGEVQASPTANTMLDRLKVVHDDLVTLVTNLATYEGNRNSDQDLLNTRVGDVTTPAAGTVNAQLAAAVTSLSSIVTNLATYEGNRNTDADLLNTRVGDTTSPSAGTLLDRLLQLKTSVDSLSANLTTYEGNRNADADLLNARVGEVQASPTANTVLDRLKTIETNTTDSATETTLTEANVSLTALAHDSWHFRNEVLSQHAEVKTAAKTVQLHLSGIFPISVLRDKTTLVSGGTVTKSGGEYLVTTAANANSAAKIDSVSRGAYVCGLGAIAEMSIRVPTAPTGQQVGEWYYADASNGYGFGVDTTGIYVWYMKATTKTKIYQANWNIDKLNGTGHSENTLSLSNGAVFFVDFTWFGYGIVEWGILAKSEEGRQHKIICHSHQTAELQSTDDVNLPLGVSVVNGTATSSFTVAVGGRVFSIMGNYTVPRRSAGTNLLYSFSASQFTDQYVLAVRKKSSAGFISIKTLLNALNVSGATRELLVKVVANPTIASPTWVAPVGVAASETACEVATNGTYTAASGVVVFSVYTSGTGSVIVQSDELDHIELTDVFSYAIVIQNQTTNTGTAKILLNWQEDW